MSIVDLLGEFDIPRVHTYGKPHVSPEGITKINEMLSRRYDITIPRGFAPLLETSRGKLGGRIEKLVRDYHDMKMTIIDKQDIGNIVERYALKGSSYVYDFTSEVLSWENGAFGNHNSCWRTSYAASIPMFLAGTGHGSGFAIRTFKPDMYGKWHRGMSGNGRCWILPYKENRMVLFNAYGERLPVFLSIVLASLPKGEFAAKEVQVKNKTEGIYMNQGRGTAIYPKGQKVSGKLTLSMPIHHTVECRDCGGRFGIADKETPWYCEECRGYCDVTGKIQGVNNLVEVRDVNVSYRRKSYYIKHGRVGREIQEGLWFCFDCLDWRGNLDEC